MIQLILSIIIITGFSLSGIIFLKKYNLSFLENIIFGFVISIFIFISISALCLFTGLYYKSFLIIIIFILLISGSVNLKYLKFFFHRIREFFNQNKLFSIIILLQLSFHFIGAVSYPLGEDALSYHLTLPKIFLQEHRFVDRPDLLNSTFPLNSELLYAVGLIFNLPELSNLFNWYFYIFLLILIYQFSMKLFQNNQASRISLIIFALTPSLNRIIGYCKNDIILVFFSTMTIYLFYLILFDRKKIYEILFIFSLSILLGIKYHSLILLFILILILTYYFVKNKFEIKFARPYLLVLIAILFSSFWYIKNIYYTGNPVYPFFNKYFSKTAKISVFDNNVKIYSNPDSVSHFSELRKSNKSIWNYIKFFYDVSLNFQDFDYWKYAIGPLYLIFFIPIIFNIFKFDKSDIIFIFIIFIYISQIYFLAPRGRFLLPVLPVLGIICSRHITEFMNRFKFMKFTILLIIILSIIINLPLTLFQHLFRIKYIIGLESKDEYISRSLYYYKGFYDTVKFANTNLNSKIDKILLMENKGFLLDIPFITGFDFMFNRYLIPYNQFKDCIEFYNYIKRLKINYILYIENHTRFINSKFFIFINELKEKKLLEIYFKKDDTVLLKLTAPACSESNTKVR